MRFCTTAACWVLFVLLPVTASALGLGNISLDSALNEPFSAEIPLQSVGGTDLTLINVSLASSETFERYDLDKPTFLNGFSFRVDKDANGQPIIRVTSGDPVPEPFVTFLVDVRWPSGRLLREYTVLLDPPLFEEAVVQSQSTVTPAITAAPAEVEAKGQVERQVERMPEPESTPVLATPAATESVEDASATSPAPAPVEQKSELRAVVEPEPEPEVMAEEATAEPEQEVAAEQEPQATFEPQPEPQIEQAAEQEPQQEPQAETLTDAYTAQRGDTLWGIANRTRGDSGLTNNQMMLALFRANPEAFLGNINALKAGSILRIPEQQEAAVVGIREANEEAVEQHAAWTSGSIVRTEEPAGDQLQLVAPSEDYSAEGEQAFAGDADADGELLTDDAGALETRIEEDERLLQVEDEELSALQDRISEEGDVALESDSELLDEEILVEGIDESVASPFADDAAEPLPDDSQLSEDAAGQAETSPVEDTTGGQVDPSKVVQLPEQGESSLIGSLLGSYWVWGAAGIGLLLLLFLVRRRVGGRDPDPEATGIWDEEEVSGVAHDQTVKDFSDLPSFDDSIVVDEVDDALAVDAAGPVAVPEPEAEPEAEPIFDEEAEASMHEAAAEPEIDIPLDIDLPEEQEAEVGFPEITESAASFEQLDAADAKADSAAPRDDEEELPLEKTISTGALLNLDQADPIAEAEFHMAYGLYDQAADLLVRALEDEADNRSYRVKLIEVYFVWENKEGFLEQATALHESISDSSDSDWNKVLILGKQLCPDSELFTGVDASAPTADAMDLELSDVGETEIDFSLGGTEVKALDDDSLDIDLDLDGDLLEGVTDHDLALDLGSETSILAEADLGDGEPESDDGAYDATMRLDDDLAATMESPTVSTPLGEAPTIDTDMGASTMESPTLDIDLNELNEFDTASTMESPTLEGPGSTSDTSEMQALNEDSLTDPASLDIDLSGLADLPDEDEAPPLPEDVDSTLSQLDNTGEFLTQEDMSKTILPHHESKDETEEEATASPFDIDSTLNQLDNTGELLSPLDMGKTIADDEPTMMPTTDVEDVMAAGSDTLEQPQPDTAADGDTAEQPEISAADISMDDESAMDGNIPQDATMTEVGTKLDLARAYIDMGDPDGARSILSEVLDEGADSQQQEARQLLEELGD
jgi:pilus assembly protein FimV